MANFDLSDRFYPQGEYPCPVCRHGKVVAMPLMEAMSCNFCQHIFTTNFEKQLLKMADSQLPLTWYWNGKRWKGIQAEGREVGIGYFIAGIVFVALPTSLIGLSSYMFSSLFWFSLIWTVLTFLFHFFILVWLVIEYYQLPIFLYFRALSRRLIINN